MKTNTKSSSSELFGVVASTIICDHVSLYGFHELKRYELMIVSINIIILPPSISSFYYIAHRNINSFWISKIQCKKSLSSTEEEYSFIVIPTRICNIAGEIIHLTLPQLWDYLIAANWQTGDMVDHCIPTIFAGWSMFSEPLVGGFDPDESCTNYSKFSRFPI